MTRGTPAGHNHPRGDHTMPLTLEVNGAPIGEATMSVLLTIDAGPPTNGHTPPHR